MIDEATVDALVTMTEQLVGRPVMLWQRDVMRRLLEGEVPTPAMRAGLADRLRRRAVSGDVPGYEFGAVTRSLLREAADALEAGSIEVVAQPCGCGRPVWSEDAEEELDLAGAEYDPNRWCPHWAVVDVPTNELNNGDVFAIAGDLPLEVFWHVCVGNADRTTGAHFHRSIYKSTVNGGPSTPSEPDQPARVLRFGWVGRQTIEPSGPEP